MMRCVRLRRDFQKRASVKAVACQDIGAREASFARLGLSIGFQEDAVKSRHAFEAALLGNVRARPTAPRRVRSQIAERGRGRHRTIDRGY
jgi:hypothetical protein